MVDIEKINWDEIDLTNVKFNSKKNLTELIDGDFLKELTSEFENVECINIILNMSSKDNNEPPKLLVLSHNNDKELINKKIGVEFKSLNSSGNEYIKKVINLLSK